MEQNITQLYNYVQERCLWQFFSRSWDRKENIDGIMAQAKKLFADAQAVLRQMIAENWVRASGVIGLQALARSAPDGATLSVVSNNVVIFPSVMLSSLSLISLRLNPEVALILHLKSFVFTGITVKDIS